MKIAVIGGGSTYTPELVNGFLTRIDALPLRELWLMDISQQRLDIVGGFASRMVAAQGNPFTIHTTTDQRAAIDGADFVITQVRVGGLEARRRDEYLGQKYGLVGQETTGVGGMAKALRTIPVILGVAEDMRETAPDAWLLNFANPAGLVSEALNRYGGGVNFVGVCNGPYGIQRNLVDILQRRRGVDAAGKDVFMAVLGLNHLSWSTGMTIDGEDVWDEVMHAYLEELRAGGNGHIPFDADTIEALWMVPSAYLQYFYETEAKIAAQAQWPPSRAEAVMSIEADLLRLYSDPALATPPPDLMKRGGAYYSTVATQLINSKVNDLDEIHAVNVRHSGAIEGWPEDWVLEMPCRVNAAGIFPLELPPLPPVAFGLMTHVKTYELLTAEAAVTGDRRTLHQALLAHPLAPAAHRVRALLDELLETNRAHLPRFWNPAGATTGGPDSAGTAQSATSGGERL